MPTRHILPRSMEIGEREAADLDRALTYLGVVTEADAWDMACELRDRRDPEASPVTRSIDLARLPEGHRCGVCHGRFDDELRPMLVGAEKWARICRACDEGLARIMAADAGTWAVTR